MKSLSCRYFTSTKMIKDKWQGYGWVGNVRNLGKEGTWVEHGK